MREVRRSALVPYSVTQMFALVADVERYPEFLPWLEAARVLARDGEWVTASLALRQATFTTRNRLVQPEFLTDRSVNTKESVHAGQAHGCDVLL